MRRSYHAEEYQTDCTSSKFFFLRCLKGCPPISSLDCHLKSGGLLLQHHLLISFIVVHLSFRLVRSHIVPGDIVSTTVETEYSLTELLPSAKDIDHRSHHLIMQFDYWLRLPSSLVDYITCAINWWVTHNRHCMDFLASASDFVWRPQRKGKTFHSRTVALTNTVNRRSQLKPQVIGVSLKHPHIAVPYIFLVNSLKLLCSLDSCIQLGVGISILHSIWSHAMKNVWVF